jgi:MFS family permease
MALTLLATVGVDYAAEMGLFTAMVLVVNIFGATQDVAIDALACSVLREEERGLANGMMFAGAYAGNAVGGSGVLFLTNYVPFNRTFFLVAGCILTVTAGAALFLREPKTAVAVARQGAGLSAVTAQVRDYARQALKAFFGSRAAVAGLVFALLPAGAYSLSLALQSNLAVELGLTDSQIGLLGLISAVLAALGCVVGGYLSDRFGRRRMLALYLVGTVIPTAAFAYVMYHHGWIMPIDPRSAARPTPPDTVITAFWALGFAYSIFQGLMYGTRTALFMDICTPAVAATQFTAYMAVLNLVIWYSGMWQGWAIESLGYPATLAIDAGAGLPCLLALPWASRSRQAPRGAESAT